MAITAADAEDDSDPARPGRLDLKAGGNYTAVANLTRAGTDGHLFNNDTSKTTPGRAG